MSIFLSHTFFFDPLIWARVGQIYCGCLWSFRAFWYKSLAAAVISKGLKCIATVGKNVYTQSWVKRERPELNSCVLPRLSHWMEMGTFWLWKVSESESIARQKTLPLILIHNVLPSGMMFDPWQNVENLIWVQCIEPRTNTTPLSVTLVMLGVKLYVQIMVSL